MREIGLTLTSSSSSMWYLWLPKREAGALEREMLVAVAPLRHSNRKFPGGQCHVDAGREIHRSGRSESFGELALAAANQPLPARVALKECKTFRLVGQPRARLEAASKMDCNSRLGIDVPPPGLQYAGVKVCPTLGGGVACIDVADAQALPGMKKVRHMHGYNGGTRGVAMIAYPCERWSGTAFIRR